MTCTLHVAWDERLTDYHFGPGHPMAPVRVELTMRLAHEFGLWSLPGVTVAVPAPAADADLELVHDEPYVAAVEAVSRWAEHSDAHEGLEGTQLRVARMFGLGTADNPVFPGMHEASALVAGATLAAARAVWSGSAQPLTVRTAVMYRASCTSSRSASLGGAGAATVTPGWLHSPKSCASCIVSSMRTGASGWSGPK